MTRAPTTLHQLATARRRGGQGGAQDSTHPWIVLESGGGEVAMALDDPSRTATLATDSRVISLGCSRR